MYIEYNNGAPDDKARLMSPQQNPTEARCLTFWYNMYGRHVDRLNVYLRTSTLDTLIFTKHGTQGNQWYKGQKTISSDDAWSVRMIYIISYNTLGATFCTISTS